MSGPATDLHRPHALRQRERTVCLRLGLHSAGEAQGGDGRKGNNGFHGREGGRNDPGGESLYAFGIPKQTDDQHRRKRSVANSEIDCVNLPSQS